MLKLYNTLTRSKDEFIPLDKETVKMYSCGPTVYSEAHVGNMRAYIFMDTLRKTLKYNGYKLNHVMNITDVGHMTSDADEGEDKMEKAARETKRNPLDIAKEYTDKFLRDIEKLNIERPEHITPATEHIREMEAYVKRIQDNGYAYETSKGVYFDTSKLPSYGELSRVNLEKQMAGARIEVDEEKRNPLDFALWIKAPENHIMKWDSIWGICYPGWHIECCAMSNKYLGEKFDIHTGGVDHIPIHHENEIAQAKGATGVNPANYWIHNEFLLMDGGKMSKSLGNCYTVTTIEERGYEPLSYRYLNFTSHYRNKLNYTWEGIDAAQTSLNRLRENYKEHANGTGTVDESEIARLEKAFLDAINDDMNMPAALAVVWEIAKNSNRSKDYAKLLDKFDTVLSLGMDREPFKKEEKVEIDENISALLERRKEARLNKDFKTSDEIRDELLSLGYKVIDTKEGQKIEKI